MNTINASRLTYGIKQAIEATGLGRSFIYQEIAEGRLTVFKVGSRTLIAAEDLKTWIDSYRSAQVSDQLENDMSGDRHE